jgi:hypothetical protein
MAGGSVQHSEPNKAQLVLLYEYPTTQHMVTLHLLFVSVSHHRMFVAAYAAGQRAGEGQTPAGSTPFSQLTPAAMQNPRLPAPGMPPGSALGQAAAAAGGGSGGAPASGFMSHVSNIWAAALVIAGTVYS